MKNYDHIKIEKKWQKEWDKNKTYQTLNNTKEKKMYVLDMFPYPSGVGLHVGHPRGYIGSDVYARMKRMEGYNVLHPMGYDAFGLPAEQYALEHKIHPSKAVEENVKTFEKQLSMIGLSYDWSRKVNTTDPKYYKWTQWIFLQIYNSWFDKEEGKARPIKELEDIFEKNGNAEVDATCSTDIRNFSSEDWKSFSKKEKQDILMKYRLAYEGYSEVNWCPEMGTVLANDEIVNDENGNPVSERGGYPVEKKLMRQWFMRITAYADRLLDGLADLEWSDHIKEIQKNWIGRSEGAEIDFKIKNHEEIIKVFTTRADTLFGVTYVVLAPEHELVQKLKSNISNWEEVEKYIDSLKNKTEEDRTKADKEKTGVELKGIKAINPANEEEVPVWIADYVLANYGTGMVMAVPAHDERDWAFAKKFNLPIKEVVIPERIDKRNPPVDGKTSKERKNVQVVVRNLKNNKILYLRSDKYNWNTFPMGGVEEGEDVIEAGRREVLEETGYKNLKNGKILGGQVRAEYFATHKDENRISYTSLVSFDLVDEELVEVSEEEKNNHVPKWAELKDLTITFMVHAEMDVWLDRLINGVVTYTEDGVLFNSGKFDGLHSEEAINKITEFVGGKMVTKYKMRDAIFARQRYWGEPIPLKHDKDGIITELGEKDLPLELPKVKSYEATGTGESPLASVSSWIKEGYETNTMPGWAGSSWYFLRYMDPQNSKELVSKEASDYWNQVDMYVGGQEHATGHLLYSRFWTNFLYDTGHISFKEPFKKMKNQGMVIAADGRRMSKRWGNVVNPDDIVKNYGADTLRVYEMFMGPFDQMLPWSTESIIGSRRFIDRVYRLQEKVSENESSPEVEKILHKTIKKVTEDIENFAFNTAISTMMIFVNDVEKIGNIGKEDFKKFLQILCPFAPHIAEELWSLCGEENSITRSTWPVWNKDKVTDDEVKIAVQVNGKVRAEIVISKDITEDSVRKIALEDKNVILWTEGKEIKRFVYVPGRVVNIVV